MDVARSWCLLARKHAINVTSASAGRQEITQLKRIFFCSLSPLFDVFVRLIDTWCSLFKLTIQYRKKKSTFYVRLINCTFLTHHLFISFILYCSVSSQGTDDYDSPLLPVTFLKLYLNLFVHALACIYTKRLLGISSTPLLFTRSCEC